MGFSKERLQSFNDHAIKTLQSYKTTSGIEGTITPNGVSWKEIVGQDQFVLTAEYNVTDRIYVVISLDKIIDGEIKGGNLYLDSAHFDSNHLIEMFNNFLDAIPEAIREFKNIVGFHKGL